MASRSVKRKDLTLKEKVEVIKYVDKMKCSQSEVAKKYGISQAQVCKLLKRKDSVLTDWRENLKLTQKRKRSGKELQVEGDLMEWFREKRARNVPISGPILKQKAEEIAERRGKSDFKATNGWFCRWKNRNQVSFKKIQGEAKDADITGANKWVREVLPGLLENYNSSSIYNCDETALYYRATPDATLCFRGEKAIGGKIQKDRLIDSSLLLKF
ncbi:CENP-B N-terminal DNA-binding domain [Popillia japonica]|uniref:CENP-B N-terminal DNA-binding domain n=1 Tax=Popillia japonica TaxID=7064 RepID=A0AAW1LDD4_POPJA